VFSANQFGFKKGSGCDHARPTLLERLLNILLPVVRQWVFIGPAKRIWQILSV